MVSNGRAYCSEPRLMDRAPASLPIRTAVTSLPTGSLQRLQTRMISSSDVM